MIKVIGKIDINKPLKYHADGSIVKLYDHIKRAKDVQQYINDTDDGEEWGCPICGHPLCSEECA